MRVAKEVLIDLEKAGMHINELMREAHKVGIIVNVNPTKNGDVRQLFFTFNKEIGRVDPNKT